MSLLWDIYRNVLKKPRATAVVDDQRTYTYGTLGAAGFFVADKIRRTTDARHVGVMLPSSGGFPAVMLGTWLLGRVLVPINFLLAREERDHVIRDSEIDTIITAEPMLDYIGGREELPGEVNVVCLQPEDFKGLPRPTWPARNRPNDTAVILYTSGTSGKPKGVVLSHDNLQFDVQACIEHAGLKTRDTFLGVLPQFHSFGLTALTLIPLYLGADVVYSARFIPKKVIELIREHEAAIFMGVPSMYAALLSVKEASEADFRSLRIPVSGGEPLSPSVAEQCQKRFGFTILEGYGLTETAPVATWSTPDRHKPFSVGQALPGVELFVLDDENELAGPNQSGEVYIAGRGVMQGYYKLAEETAEAIVELEVPGRDEPVRTLRTGDIGYLDEDGYLFITGRKKEMLIIGGENVFPREIEDVLNEHEAVKASGVIGRQDDVRGEVPIAYVELEEEGDVSPDELRQFCRQRLAQYKVPREIHKLEELPRSPTGKVLRRKLKEQ